MASKGAARKVNCPICGGARFGPGPKGRASPGGRPPRCLTCGALERHRAFRLVFEALRPLLAGTSALQFSDDPSAPRAAFGAFEVSIHGGANHLDMAKIDRADRSYDVVIANHVLEHLADDIAALGELRRVAGEGLVILSVPDLLRVPATREYGGPRADKHGHYRIYGPDVAQRLRRAVPDWRALGVVPSDPVTAEPDRLTLLSPSSARLADCARHLAAAGLAPFDAFAEPEGASARATP